MQAVSNEITQDPRAVKLTQESCYLCEDGGNVTECTICSQVFCYGILGQPRNEEHPPCVTVPVEIEENDDRPFPCPECLSRAQARSAPYIINRAARLTMRLALRSSVVLVVFHISSLRQLALSIYDQILSALCSFEINVASVCTLLHEGLAKENEEELQDQLAEDAEFHLAVVFVTESQPGGGWWSKTGAQSAEEEFLRFLANQVRRLARRALSVRYFGAVCGSNLPGKGVIGNIQKALTPTMVLSLVLPTSPSILLCDYAHILPEIFLNLYYFGADLRPSLYKVWGKSAEVMTHTGLLTIDRKAKDLPFSITKLLHSPLDVRPLGVQLPSASSVCGCFSDDDDDGTWVLKKQAVIGPESIFVYQSACCGVGLQLAVFPSRRRMIKRNDIMFTEEDWDPETQSFQFVESRMVRMITVTGLLKPATDKGKDLPLSSHGPWTIAGKAIAKKKVASC
ncbi:hypothetical protein FRC06_005155 [Ceratobasidium sp. 370]|nr:hypothetical protein FRC06_005155 [Ceratobasidium sp. 370]